MSFHHEVSSESCEEAVWWIPIHLHNTFNLEVAACYLSIVPNPLQCILADTTGSWLHDNYVSLRFIACSCFGWRFIMMRQTFLEIIQIANVP